MVTTGAAAVLLMGAPSLTSRRRVAPGGPRRRPTGQARRAAKLPSSAARKASVGQATGPGVDRGDRVGGRRVAGLVLAVVPGHRAVRRLRLDGPTVRGHQ